MGCMRHQVFGFMGLLVLIMAFQNCSEGFRYSSGVKASESSSANNPPPTSSTPAGASNANFKACYAATPTDGNAISACLNSTPTNGMTYTAATISTCLLAGNATDLNLAICMSTQGQFIQEYRQPKQSDINSCANVVGNSAIAGCLGKRGIKAGVTQTAVDQCLVSDGLTGVEKCLRRAGALLKRPALFQSDANLCEKLEGTLGLALCLQNSDLLPATVTQAVIDGCITAVTSARVVRCLRVNFHISNVVMQAHFNECLNAVGQAAIATCFDNNGLLPVVIAAIATFQTEIDNCVTVVGAVAIAKCMRNKSFISSKIMQPHIASCFDAAGLNAFTCLNANFAVIPPLLTDVELKACFAANLNTPANAARCLATKRIISSAPSQDHINACARFAGNVADATGTRPGQVGIATCLDRSGALPAPLLQANINTCITNVGLAAVSNCLHAQGVVPSFSRFNLAGGIFAVSCAGCHGVALPGGMNVAVYSTVLPKVIPGSSATSLLYGRITAAAATQMPPLPAAPLAAAQIATLARWIDQGANDN